MRAELSRRTEIHPDKCASGILTRKLRLKVMLRVEA